MNDSAVDSAIKIENLSLAYNTVPVIFNIDWEVPENTLAAIIGPNGGGKSTLLKSLVGLLSPLHGKVEVFSEDPKVNRRAVAYLPQTEEVDWLFPITTLEVVLHGRLVYRRWWQRVSKFDKQIAFECLETVKMADYSQTPIGSLSGGQRQRIFIARALAQRARLIILDEPAAGLDAAAQHDLLELFKFLKHKGHTLVITTHDLNCLPEHFDTVLGLNKQVIFEGSPSKVLTAKVVTKLFAKHIPVVKPTGEVTIHEH